MIINGNCIDEMKKLKDNVIDAIITDPPYNLGFMGKKWDTIKDYQKSTEMWGIEALRVLKPGGYGLIFGGTRTFHREACGLEDAGFEIRDTIMWLYGSGFPKGHNIGKNIDKKSGQERKVVGKGKSGLHHKANVTNFAKWNVNHNKMGCDITIPTSLQAKQWEGWNTNLKPAYEPIIMCRKPFKGTVVDNVLKWGTGGMNIDACRIGTDTIKIRGGRKSIATGDDRTGAALGIFGPHEPLNTIHKGRYPANVILDEISAEMLDEQSGISSGKYIGPNARPRKRFMISGNKSSNAPDCFGDKGGASRFFYCAKASKSERNMGCEDMKAEPIKGRDSGQDIRNVPYKRRITPIKNFHPTIKPIKLMEYLIKMISVENAVILDPFVGSGTTCIACKKLRRKCIGIDNNAGYVKIAEERIKSVKMSKKLGDKK